MTYLPQSVSQRVKGIRLLALDVDGVLTDGVLTYSAHGEELKGFHAHDGMGLKLLRDSGIEVAIITRRMSEAVTKRLNELNIAHVYQGQLQKREALEDLMAKLKLSADNIAYVGDDIPDIVVMREVGLSVAVANARSPVHYYAHWQTANAGGYGAVRDVCELILQCQGLYEQALNEHL